MDKVRVSISSPDGVNSRQSLAGDYHHRLPFGEDGLQVSEAVDVGAGRLHVGFGICKRSSVLTERNSPICFYFT